MRAIRAVLWAVIWAFVGAFALAFTLYVMRARSMPDLAPWHQPLLGEDLGEDATASLDAYLAREARLFEELGRGVQRSGPSGPTAKLNRFNPESRNNPANRERNWNRSFELAVDEPRGGVLLVHGLSDSPYSLRSAAEIFHARGFWVLGLRMPGHGTLPGELTRATWRDWRDAVRMGARHVAGAVGERPLVLVGYSNGGALVADYAVRVIEGSGDPAPTALVMLSPALGVSRVAAFASVPRVLSCLPGLEKLEWTDILPEYDPYKYNSFPIQAGEQIHALTKQLARATDTLEQLGIESVGPPPHCDVACRGAITAPVHRDNDSGRMFGHFPGQSASLRRLVPRRSDGSLRRLRVLLRFRWRSLRRNMPPAVHQHPYEDRRGGDDGGNSCELLQCSHSVRRSSS